MCSTLRCGPRGASPLPHRYCRKKLINTTYKCAVHCGVGLEEHHHFHTGIVVEIINTTYKCAVHCGVGLEDHHHFHTGIVVEIINTTYKCAVQYIAVWA